MSKKSQDQPVKEFPLYRRGTKEEVTSEDLTDHIAKILSDIYSLRYKRKITVRFGKTKKDDKE